MAHSRRKLLPSQRTRRRLDPQREIVLHHVTDGPARGWFHTHGLAAHGKPELEIRNLPLFLGSSAGRLLNDVAGYLLNEATKPLLAGEVMLCGRSVIQFVEARPDADAGYDPEHYADVRLLLVDPPEAACMCDECAEELAGRPRIPS